MRFQDLPFDVLACFVRFLNVSDLVRLAQCSRFFHSFIEHYGWKLYSNNHPRPSNSLVVPRERWSFAAQVRYDTLTDRSWSRKELMATPLMAPWKGRFMPILAASQLRLLVASGQNITAFAFTTSTRDDHSPAMALESKTEVTLGSDAQTKSDITAFSVLTDTGHDQAYAALIGRQDGSIQHAIVRQQAEGNTVVSSTLLTDIMGFHNSDLIEHISYRDSLSLALSSNGSATLSRLQLDSATSSTRTAISLQKRSWVGLLETGSSTPFTAFGTSSSTPLLIHNILEHSLSPSPSLVLSSGPSQQESRSGMAVYGICQAPPGSPWGASPLVVTSGWYDGYVRCHDLRDSSRVSGPSHATTSLRPVLELADPWSYEPIYCVASGGGSASHVAAGSARHSVVSFWDVRSPETGWSVHAPGNDPSPVYDIILESSKLFGTTQSRPFVLDFGPDPTTEAYPSLPSSSTDRLRRRKMKDGAARPGFYVTKYHWSSNQTLFSANNVLPAE